VRLGAPALARLISALWQSYPPLVTRTGRAKFQMQNFALLDTRRPKQKRRFTSRVSGTLRIS
jgi:hypothetical protein